MMEICKEISGLDIKLRKEKLQSLFHVDAFIYAQALLIAKFTLKILPTNVSDHRRNGQQGLFNPEWNLI